MFIKYKYIENKPNTNILVSIWLYFPAGLI